MLEVQNKNVDNSVRNMRMPGSVRGTVLMFELLLMFSGVGVNFVFCEGTSAADLPDQVADTESETEIPLRGPLETTLAITNDGSGYCKATTPPIRRQCAPLCHHQVVVTTKYPNLFLGYLLLQCGTLTSPKTLHSESVFKFEKILIRRTPHEGSSTMEFEGNNVSCSERKWAQLTSSWCEDIVNKLGAEIGNVNQSKLVKHRDTDCPELRDLGVRRKVKALNALGHISLGEKIGSTCTLVVSTLTSNPGSFSGNKCKYNLTIGGHPEPRWIAQYLCVGTPPKRKQYRNPQQSPGGGFSALGSVDRVTNEVGRTCKVNGCSKSTRDSECRLKCPLLEGTGEFCAPQQSGCAKIGYRGKETDTASHRCVAPVDERVGTPEREPTAFEGNLCPKDNLKGRQVWRGHTEKRAEYTPRCKIKRKHNHDQNVCRFKGNADIKVRNDRFDQLKSSLEYSKSCREYAVMPRKAIKKECFLKIQEKDGAAKKELHLLCTGEEHEKSRWQSVIYNICAETQPKPCKGSESVSGTSNLCSLNSSGRNGVLHGFQIGSHSRSVNVTGLNPSDKIEHSRRENTKQIAPKSIGNKNVSAKIVKGDEQKEPKVIPCEDKSGNKSIQEPEGRQKVLTGVKASCQNNKIESSVQTCKQQESLVKGKNLLIVFGGGSSVPNSSASNTTVKELSLPYPVIVAFVCVNVSLGLFFWIALLCFTCGALK